MFATTDDRSEVRALLEHAALCLALGSALGFISGGFAALELDAFVALSKIVHYSIALVCIAASFAILWCAPDGPQRWRPFVVPRKAAEFIFGSAAFVIVLGGAAALTAEWL